MHMSILRLLLSCVGVRSDAQIVAPTTNTQLSLASCKQIFWSLSWVSDVPLICIYFSPTVRTLFWTQYQRLPPRWVWLVVYKPLDVITVQSGRNPLPSLLICDHQIHSYMLSILNCFFCNGTLVLNTLVLFQHELTKIRYRNKPVIYHAELKSTKHRIIHYSFLKWANPTIIVQNILFCNEKSQ